MYYYHYHRPVVVYTWYHPYHTVGDGDFPMYGVYVICSIIFFICLMICLLSIYCPSDPPPPVYVDPMYDPYGPDMVVVDPGYCYQPYPYYAAHGGYGHAPRHYPRAQGPPSQGPKTQQSQSQSKKTSKKEGASSQAPNSTSKASSAKSTSPGSKSSQQQNKSNSEK